MNKNTKASVVRNFNKEKFEKWCIENNKNPQNDISIVEYVAKELNDEMAKEFMERFEKGEVKADEITVQCFNKNADKEMSEEEINKKFEGIMTVIKGIAIIAGVEEGAINKFLNDLKKISIGGKYAYVEGMGELYAPMFHDLIKTATDWIKLEKFVNEVLEK